MSKLVENRPVVIGCDVDDTLAPNMFHSRSVRAEGMRSLGRLGLTLLHAQSKGVLYYGAVTGRTKQSLDTYALQMPVLDAVAGSMDFAITGVGTEIFTRTRGAIYFQQDTTWPPHESWKRDDIAAALAQLPELTMQPDSAQTDYKLSYFRKGSGLERATQVVEGIETTLANAALRAEVIYSGNSYLDILPHGVAKGSALMHTATVCSPDERPFIVAAGDSLNDCTMLQVADLAILPANADSSLVQWAEHTLPPERFIHSERPFAAAILDGLEQHNIV
jgi:HAD superfamily hydrolase (TIGR01484 family)